MGTWWFIASCDLCIYFFASGEDFICKRLTRSSFQRHSVPKLSHSCDHIDQTYSLENCSITTSHHKSFQNLLFSSRTPFSCVFLSLGGSLSSTASMKDTILFTDTQKALKVWSMAGLSFGKCFEWHNKFVCCSFKSTKDKKYFLTKMNYLI